MDVTAHIEWLKGIWGDADLLDGVRIEVSRRMTRSVGRCYAQRGVIRISERFLRRAAGDRELLEEVLTHELAHLVVYRKYGRKAKPHGREWRTLMDQAGCTPRTHLPVGRLDRTGRGCAVERAVEPSAGRASTRGTGVRERVVSVL